MTTETQGSMNPNGGDQGSTTSFIEYLAVLAKWKNFILVNCVSITIIAIIISFVLPKWYRATASVLPPKEPNPFSVLGGTNSILKGLGTISKLAGGGQTEGAYNYFAILKSRTAMEAVVKKFDLEEEYNIRDRSMEKAVKELEDNTSFEYQDDDYITIEVLDKSPSRAAEIANYFIDILNTMSIQLGSEEARGNREFIETRVEVTQDSLRTAEDALKQYQERTGLMLPTPDQSAGMSAIADLYVEKTKKEIEVGILERSATPDNESLVQARLELEELNKKLSQFPGAGLETVRLYRDVVTQQKILEFLLPLFEQAKINEKKDNPVLVVLDRAIPPEKKARPQRMLIILSAAFLSLFGLIALVYALEGILRRGGSDATLESRLANRVRRVCGLYGMKFSA
jgi:uncharacterized protein involved in exopolysaccharide biosynthesis